MSAKPERWIVIPRWEEFQHYSKRTPPWIKDYTRQLHDADYLDLELGARGLLHGLRLLYAELDGIVSESRARMMLGEHLSDVSAWHQGRATRAFRQHLESLNHAGFIRFSASRPLALREQRAEIEAEQAETTTPPTPSKSPPHGAAPARSPLRGEPTLEPQQADTSLPAFGNLDNTITDELERLSAFQEPAAAWGTDDQERAA